MIGILQVYGAAPKTLHDACRNIPDRLHPEPWNFQEPIEPREVDEAPGTALLRDQKEAGEEERLAEKDSPNLAPGKGHSNILFLKLYTFTLNHPLNDAHL